MHPPTGGCIFYCMAFVATLQLASFKNYPLFGFATFVAVWQFYRHAQLFF